MNLSGPLDIARPLEYCGYSMVMSLLMFQYMTSRSSTEVATTENEKDIDLFVFLYVITSSPLPYPATLS